MLVLAALAGCGGDESGPGVQTISGAGYSFQAPGDWEVLRSGRTAAARDGEEVISVTLFPLDRPYRPSLWPQVRRELDRVTGRLARKLGASVDERRDGSVGGRTARLYRLSHAGDGTQRIAFVLVGKREYQLLCRGEDRGACDGLLASFRLT